MRNLTRPQITRIGQHAPIGTRIHRRFDGGKLEPAEWRRETCHDLDCPLGVHILICCPACGEVAELLDSHYVDRMGVVSPVWSCREESCSLVQWLELGGHEVDP